MKVENLMVGDWYYWEAEGKKYPYQVKPEDFVKGEISNFQPILLTREILLKNNFKFNEIYYEGVFDIIEEYNGNSWRVGRTIFEGHSNPNTVKFCSIMYVHELQHLLKQFGVTNVVL